MMSCGNGANTNTQCPTIKLVFCKHRGLRLILLLTRCSSHTSNNKMVNDWFNAQWTSQTNLFKDAIRDFSFFSFQGQ